MTQPLIKLLLLAGIALVGYYAVRGSRRALHRVVWRGFVVVGLGAAVVSVLFPDILTWLAEKVGVGRGTDLLLYLVVIAFMLVSVVLFRRISELERKYVALARELAVRRATEDSADWVGHQELPALSLETRPDRVQTPGPAPASNGNLALRRGLLAFVVVLLAEAVWILAVPPFRGSDEVDHVYRATGVAAGQWHLSEGAQHGRGLLVWVPTDVVRAADAQCTSLSYVGHDNCQAVRTSGDRSLVATAAGGYDPFFYAVVGTVAKPFHGAGVDYALRAATAVLCALLLALGVGLMSVAGTGRWATLGILAALTPEVAFSGAIPSPNGVEMGLGLVLWAALLAAVRRDDDHVLQRRLLLAAGAAAVPLTFVRLLGPLWVLLIVGAVGLTIGARGTWALVRRHRWVMTAVVVATTLGVCWWLGWQVIASHADGVQADKDRELWVLAFNLPAYTMQMVGAFPFRDQPAPLGVYPLAFFVICLLVFAAWRRGAPQRAARAVPWIVLVALVVPVALSLYFMPSLGAFWQGRYELPFVIGILPLCGLLLDRAGFAPHEGPKLVALSGVLLTIVAVVSVVNVERMEQGRAVSASDPHWADPGSWALGAGMLAACLLAGLLFRLREPQPDAG